MTDDDRGEQLLPPEEERLLRAVLHDAVADVAPRDGLAEIRRRTRPRRARSRRWVPALAGVGAVVATVAVATSVVGTLGDDGDPGPAAGGESSGPADGLDASSLVGRAAATYFIGDSPGGPRLFREFQPVEPGGAAQVAAEAVERLAVDEGPSDPDYRTVWPAGSFGEVRVEPTRIVVELDNAEALEAPVGITPEEQLLGVQQVVYTAEASVGEVLPVAFEWRDAPATQVLGIEVEEEVERDRRDAIASPVNISDPAEGLEVDAPFVATGSMADTVSTVRWRISAPDEDGGSTLTFLEGRAEPAADPDPFAPGWQTEPIDVGRLRPGDYVFVAYVSSEGQASDSPATYSDTRTITVR